MNYKTRTFSRLFYSHKMYLMSVNPFEPFHLFNLSLWTDSESPQPPPPIPTFCTGIFFEELASSYMKYEIRRRTSLKVYVTSR